MALSVGAAAAFVLWQLWFGGTPVVNALLTSNRGPFYSALATIAGSLLGFVMAALAVLVAFVNIDSPRMEAIRSSTAYGTLWTVFGSTVRWLGVTTVACVVTLLIDVEKTVLVAWMITVVRACVLLLGLLSGFRLASAIWALEQVMKLANKRRGDYQADEA